MGSTSTEFRTWLAAQQVGDASPTLTPEGHFRITLPAAVGEVNIYPFKDDLEIAEYRITRISDGEAIFFLHVMLDDLTRAQDLFSQMAEVLADEQSHRTTHVLLCCTSALTTSFFASKMNEVAHTLSLDYDFAAMSVERS